MTTKQLQSLLRQAIREIGRSNADRRQLRAMGLGDRGTSRRIAKNDMLLAKMRRAVARPKAARKAK